MSEFSALLSLDDSLRECYRDEHFHYLFPLSPRFALYLLIDAPLTTQDACSHEPPFLQCSGKVSISLNHDIESAIDVYQRNTMILQSDPAYIIFVSARAMTRTLRYYNDRRWMQANLDYRRLLEGCFEESVTFTLLQKASIEVIDLTDDITVIGECAISFGTFADVWKAVWADRQERGKQTLVRPSDPMILLLLTKY